jgi:hypothetical protein
MARCRLFPARAQVPASRQARYRPGAHQAGPPGRGRAITAGLLRRKADQQDGRRSPLQLTTAGRAYLKQVHHYRRTQFARAMSGWTDLERQTFARLLTRFVAALDQPGTGQPDT